VEGDQVPKVDSYEIQGVIWLEPREALKLNIDRYLKHFITRLLDKSAPFIVSWK